MALPRNFEEIMFPLLNMVSDGQNHNVNNVIDSLADYFQLTPDEKALKYPSGNDFVFRNKSRFARLYLIKAGLLEHPQRGYIKISDLGLEVLKKNPKAINLKDLERLPKFIEFKMKLKEKSGDARKNIEESNEIETQTPHELIEYGYQKIKNELSEEILSYTKKCSPQFFESLVVDLLINMGYGGSVKDAGKAIGQSGDGGIDGIIKEDKLGLDVIYIQAKRWEGVVGRPEIQKFVGALALKHANKGVFITTSGFTKDAQDFVGQIANKVILIDGETLSELMVEHNLGVSVISNYEVKKIDLDYFSEE